MDTFRLPLGSPTKPDRPAIPLAWPLLIVAMAAPTFLTWLEFVALVDRSQGANVLQQLAIVLGKTIQFSFPIFAFWLLERRWPRPEMPSFRGWEIGVGFALIVALGMFGLYFGWLRGLPELAHTPTKVQEKMAQFGIDSVGRFVLFAFLLSVVHALLEEYYWRWFVFGRLAKLIPLVPAIILSSLAFMAHHVVVLGEYYHGHFWTVAVPLSLCVAVGGAFWAWLYHRTGTIWAAWLSHVILDTAIMVIGYDLAFVRS